VGKRVDVDIGLCVRLPGSAVTSFGSASQGAAAAAAANLPENSPKTRCCDRSLIKPKVAISQNAVVPPLASTTSYPFGTE
jgi:hypothetical protein